MCSMDACKDGNGGLVTLARLRFLGLMTVNLWSSGWSTRIWVHLIRMRGLCKHMAYAERQSNTESTLLPVSFEGSVKCGAHGP